MASSLIPSRGARRQPYLEDNRVLRRANATEFVSPAIAGREHLLHRRRYSASVLGHAPKGHSLRRLDRIPAVATAGRDYSVSPDRPAQVRGQSAGPVLRSRARPVASDAAVRPRAPWPARGSRRPCWSHRLREQAARSNKIAHNVTAACRQQCRPPRHRRSERSLLKRLAASVRPRLRRRTAGQGPATTTGARGQIHYAKPRAMCEKT